MGTTDPAPHFAARPAAPEEGGPRTGPARPPRPRASASRRRKCCVVHFRVLSDRRRASRVSRPPPGSWSQERRHRHGGHQRWAWGAGPRGQGPRGLGRGGVGDDRASVPPAVPRAPPLDQSRAARPRNAVSEFAGRDIEGCDREGCPAPHIRVVSHPRHERGPLRSPSSASTPGIPVHHLLLASKSEAS